MTHAADLSAADALATERAIRLTMARRLEVMALATAILRDAGLAEEVFQEVLLVVVRRAADLPGDDGFAPWVREIARRQALHAARLRQRAPPCLDPATIADLMPVLAEAAEDWRQDRHEALRTCLAGLGKRARALVEARYREDLTGDDLAQRLGLTLSSAYSLLSRAHRALEDCIRRRLIREVR